MGAVVRELYVFRQRGQPGEAVESAWFRRGIGMEGDRHAAGGERQTSLLAGETRDWMEKQTEPGLLLPPLQGKPDNGGNRYHPVKYGGSSGGGRGGIPRLRVMEKSVFQSVFTMKKEFSAAFRQEPYFWK